MIDRKEKQIEEMACAICGNSKICCGEGIRKCLLFPQMWRYANNAYKEGYRKSSEVAREIFEEIEKAICGITAKNAIECTFEIDRIEYIELKNKYTEGKE